MAANELLVNDVELVQTLDADLPRRHESNTVNTRNNRGFALLKGDELVEVVRMCRKTTLIRRSLTDNTYTFEKVSTEDLSGYDHPVRKS